MASRRSTDGYAVGVTPDAPPPGWYRCAAVVLLASAVTLTSACGSDPPERLTGAYTIFAGGSSACAGVSGVGPAPSDGPACWGFLTGSLGDGPPFAELERTQEYSCAVRSDQTVVC